MRYLLMSWSMRSRIARSWRLIHRAPLAGCFESCGRVGFAELIPPYGSFLNSLLERGFERQSGQGAKLARCTNILDTRRTKPRYASQARNTLKRTVFSMRDDGARSGGADVG